MSKGWNSEQPEEGTRPKVVDKRGPRQLPPRNNPLQDMDLKKTGTEISKGIAQLLQKKEPSYVPVSKSLDQIGMNPRIMDVTIGDVPVECFVIPIQELIYKEWQFMTGGQYTSSPKVDESDV